LGEDVLSKALIDEIKLYSETPIIRRSAVYTMEVDILADIPTASFDRVVQCIAHELGQTDAENQHLDSPTRAHVNRVDSPTRAHVNRVRIGDQNDCAIGLRTAPGVHCVKDPCHKRMVGYKRNLSKDDPSYLAAQYRGDLFLNMIDPPARYRGE
jgi:hypothetical protein